MKVTHLTVLQQFAWLKISWLFIDQISDSHSQRRLVIILELVSIAFPSLLLKRGMLAQPLLTVKVSADVEQNKQFWIWQKLGKKAFYSLGQVMQTSQKNKSHISYCITAKSMSYTLAHMNIAPSLPHWNTYLCSAMFAANITHQHHNDRPLQAIYCYACYLVEFLAFT